MRWNPRTDDLHAAGALFASAAGVGGALLHRVHVRASNSVASRAVCASKPMLSRSDWHHDQNATRIDYCGISIRDEWGSAYSVGGVSSCGRVRHLTYGRVGPDHC